MKLTQISLSNPVAVAVGGILIVLFGIISLARLPVQLTPDVERPRIYINTSWRAASPQEIESEILEPQESVLKGMPGLTKLEASASQGRGSITLEMGLDVSMTLSLIEVINRLNQVSSYPIDAKEPFIRSGSQSFEGAIAWFAIRPLEGNQRPIASYFDFIVETVQSRVERVNGIASSNVFGGRGNEVRISFDPYKAASLGINIATIPSKLSGNNDVSGGFADVGRRNYTVRFAGKYAIEDIGNLVLDWYDGSPVHLRDIATIDVVMVDTSGSLALNGGPSMAMNVIPAPGVNVLDVIERLKKTVHELDAGVLKQNGLSMVQVYDESVYIKDSINMVRNNLLLGMCLAIGVLWWFLRKFRATLMVALAIPLCLLCAFSFLDTLGRTLNTISLAGLAFAVGMVLDAAIVVLENIVRLREKGVTASDAALRGTTQVWGALLASTVTTVAIFLPVVFLKDISGQLFADLALTISIAVVASLVVAVTVLPTTARLWLSDVKLVDKHAHWWPQISQKIMEWTETPKKRKFWILCLLLLPMLVTYLILPKADYLPTGNQNQVRAFILPPPGMNARTSGDELISTLVDRLQPYLDGEKDPKIKVYWLGIFGQFGFLGSRAEDPKDIKELVKILNSEILAELPDTMGFANQSPVFGRFGGGRAIDVDLQSRDTQALIDVGGMAMGLISQTIPGARVRPIPGLELAEPELRLIPKDHKIAQAGFDRQQIALLVRAMVDGAFVSEYFDGERRTNVVLRAEKWSDPEQLMGLPIVTPKGDTLALGQLLTMERTAGPSQIRRVDRKRTVTLRVTPPEDMALEEVLNTLKYKVGPKLIAALPDDGFINYSGSADGLKTAISGMAGSFLLAIAILYLLISALFRSFVDSLWVVMTIPLATVGGVVGLSLVNLIVFQSMDLLTMIGFVILLGLVVNNAILLVHQARAAEREGLSRRDAVEQSIRLRLRPILMSTLTSIFGMLPLLLMPGAGTELYRGLATVIIGGMSVSTVFTLVLLPSLLRMGELKPTHQENSARVKALQASVY